MEIKRGDVVTCVFSREYGKPRPGVVVQSDLFNATHPSLTICPITGVLHQAPLCRLTVAPSPKNGLKKRSQVMIDKLAPVRTPRVREVIGHLTAAEMGEIDRAIKLWLGLS